jgi:hypothetical protein
MKRNSIFLATALAVGLAFAGGTAARALVLVDKSLEQKQRKDIGKQGAKHTLCMAKAAIKCEKNGVVVGAECDLTDPAMSTVPDPNNKIIPKLTADLNKCTSKLNYAKKSATANSANDYTGIGCPGDAVAGGADDPHPDLAAYQAATGPNTRAQLEILQLILSGICSDNQCTVDQASLGLKYAKGILKCIAKCENDYKNKKGDGGPTDAITNCNPGGGGDANFTACTGKALSKAPGLDPGLKGPIDGAITDAQNDLYNEDDCP